MGLFGKDPSFQPAYDNIARNRGLYESIELPEYDELSPELYDFETANYELTQEDPALRSMQLESLARFNDLSEQGLSEMDEAGFAKARLLGDQVAKSQTDAALQNAEMRGVAGGGQEFAMREAAGQAAAQRAQEAALAEQSARAQQRQMALSALANQQSNVRQQDHTANSANTDIINRFNQANTQNRQAVNNANVDQRNQAFQYNQGLKDKRYNNQLGRADRIAGNNNEATRVAMADADATRKQRESDINSFMGMASMGMNAYGGGRR